MDEKGKKLSIDLARPKKPFGRLGGGGREGGEEGGEEEEKEGEEERSCQDPGAVVVYAYTVSAEVSWKRGSFPKKMPDE